MLSLSHKAHNHETKTNLKHPGTGSDLVRGLFGLSKRDDMSHLSRLLEKYPTCYYCEDMDTICVDVNEDPQTIEEDATQIIEEHFEGETIQTPTDTFRVPGKEYVNHVGGVSEAFKLVGIEAW